jgi:hypothetical protein
MDRLKSQLHVLHVLKDAKPQARRTLPTFASDELMKAIVDFAINALNANHKLTKEDKTELCKYKNRLQAFANPNFIFKIECKLSIQTGGFIIL